MLVIKDNEMVIITTKLETFTFHKSTHGICGVCLERYNKPLSKLEKDKIAYISEKGQLTPIVEEYPTNSFSFEIKAQNNNKYLKVQLNEGQLVVVPIFAEPERTK